MVYLILEGGGGGGRKKKKEEKEEKKRRIILSFRFYILGCKIKATSSKVQILSDSFEQTVNAVKQKRKQYSYLPIGSSKNDGLTRGHL